MIKGPISYAHAIDGDKTYCFFGDHHERNTKCRDNKKNVKTTKFSEYIDDLMKEEVHFFTEVRFFPNPTPEEYNQLIAYGELNAKNNKSNSPFFQMVPWFWQRKQENPNYFHPLDIRRETPYYKGYMSSFATYFLESPDLDKLFDFYMNKNDSFENEIYIKTCIQQVRQTSYRSKEIDLYLYDEWKEMKKYYGNLVDYVPFCALIMDAYALHKMFQPEYKHVVCYVGHSHWSRYKRFLDYIGLDVKTILEPSGCIKILEVQCGKKLKF